MGSFAEDSARDYPFTRQAMDDYAVNSLAKAKAASDCGGFDHEIAPVEVCTRKGVETVTRDEQPSKADPTRIRR